MTALLERLGYPSDARVVIVNADELGASHATNTGVYDSLRSLEISRPRSFWAPS